MKAENCRDRHSFAQGVITVKISKMLVLKNII